MKLVSVAARFGMTWVFLFGVYLLLTLQASAEELVAGALTAGVAAGLLEAVRARTAMVFRLRLGWFGLLLRRVPGRALADCAVLAGALGRSLVSHHAPMDEFRAVPFEAAAGETREAAGRRALVVAAASLSPNSVVVAVDAANRRLLVHQLVHTPEPPGGGDAAWPL